MHATRCALAAVGVPDFVSGISGAAAGILTEETIKHVGNKKTKQDPLNDDEQKKEESELTLKAGDINIDEKTTKKDLAALKKAAKYEEAAAKKAA